jgi:hypothetical protein
VGGKRHVPVALSPGKTQYPLYRWLVGPQGRSERVRKISPPPGFDLRTVQPVASRCTDWAIPVLLYLIAVRPVNLIAMKAASIWTVQVSSGHVRIFVTGKETDCFAYRLKIWYMSGTPASLSNESASPPYSRGKSLCGTCSYKESMLAWTYSCRNEKILWNSGATCYTRVSEPLWDAAR